MTSPSADAPRDGVKGPGTYTCLICRPTVHDKGGQREFTEHYMRLHYEPYKPPPKGKP